MASSSPPKMLTGQDPHGVAAKLAIYKQALQFQDSGTKLLRVQQLITALEAANGSQNLLNYVDTVVRDLKGIAGVWTRKFFEDLASETSYYQMQWISFVKASGYQDSWEAVVKIWNVEKQWTKLVDKDRKLLLLSLVDDLKLRLGDSGWVGNFAKSTVTKFLDAVDNEGPAAWLSALEKLSSNARADIALVPFPDFLKQTFYKAS